MVSEKGPLTLGWQECVKIEEPTRKGIRAITIIGLIIVVLSILIQVNRQYN